MLASIKYKYGSSMYSQWRVKCKQENENLSARILAFVYLRWNIGRGNCDILYQQAHGVSLLPEAKTIISVHSHIFQFAFNLSPVVIEHVQKKFVRPLPKTLLPYIRLQQQPEMANLD